MEDQTIECENPGNEENGGKMTWIVNKGLAVGKKILVTGFVISSAPVVIPPLLVISMLGLACAVPYGFFLASYACTEKLITTLLPRPPTPITFHELGTKDEDEKYVADVDMENEEEELKRRVEMRLGKNEKGNEEDIKNKDEIVDKNGYVEDVDEDVAEVDEKPPEEICGVVIAIEGEEKNGSNIREEEVPFEVTDVGVELCQSDEPKDNEELVGETRGLLEEIKDKGMLGEGVDQDKQSAKGESVGAEGLNETDRNVEETVTPLGDGKAHERRAGDTEDNYVKQNHKLNRDKEIAVSTNADAREIAGESGLDLFDDKKATHILYSADNGTSEGTKQSSDKSVNFLEITLSSRVHAPESGASGGITSDEVLDSEEKIWKQIDAMRAVVGYTSARHATCIEELKALYIFTGVEPPASFEDPSDLGEIDGKLRFLMSIVGVK